jgi:multicomponent Na+:H+ antiporter subunit A
MTGALGGRFESFEVCREVWSASVPVAPAGRLAEEINLLLLVLVHLLAALVLVVVGRPLGRRALLVAALAPAAAFVWGVSTLAGLDGGDRVQTWQWIPELGLELRFRVDGLSALFVLLIGGIGALVFVYAASYLHDHDRPVRLASLLLTFAGAMLGLVLADNVLLMFLFWELTSVTSFLLIGTDDERASARASATQALLITGAGGLALFAGLVLLAQSTGSSALSVIAASPPAGSTAAVAVALVALGAMTKSAQVPFHTWLPGAMAAPTPVSAYLHSATMVKAGIYLVARFGPNFAEVGWWRAMIVGGGCATLLVGGWRALRQNDLKLLLAFGTVSQLGLLMILFGLGTPYAWQMGIVLLVAHAVYKAALFMSVGIIDHQAHTRDLRRLDRLGRRLGGLTIAATVAAASMAGIPPLLGFVAKEGALSSLSTSTTVGYPMVLIAVGVGSAMAVAAGIRFVLGAFGPASVGVDDPIGPDDVAPPSVPIVAPVVVLSVLTVVAGLAPGVVVQGVFDQAVDWLGWVGIDHEVEHLALWHGFNLALALSVVAIVGGAALWAVGDRIERRALWVPALPGAQESYEGLVRGLLRLADRVTGVVQSGSLPRYLAVWVTAAVVAPGIPLMTALAAPDDLVLADHWVQIVISVLMVAAAVGVVATKQRFAAVLLVGAVGYGMAALFVVQGAPDLAIAQLLIETLGVVLFVLVLRHLPEHFTTSTTLAVKLRRAALAATVGVFVFAFLLTASANRTNPGVAPEYIEKSLPEGGGNNVVNVIIVDFRGFDTLGEITVLLAAALGALALVRPGGSGRRKQREGGPGDDPADGPASDRPTPAVELDA